MPFHLIALVLLASTPAPPPIIASPRITRSDAPEKREPPALLDFDVTVPEGRIWRDTLRVGPGGGSASISIDRTEANPADCAPQERRVNVYRTSFRLGARLVRSGGDESDPLYQIDVTWSRPGMGAICLDGTRKVEFNQSVELPANKQVVVNGDGGLTVRIVRH